MKKFKKRKGLYGVIVRKDSDGYFVAMSCYHLAASEIKNRAQYLADRDHQVYIPLFFRNHYQAEYYHLDTEGITLDTIPDRHRGCEYKPTA